MTATKTAPLTLAAWFAYPIGRGTFGGSCYDKGYRIAAKVGSTAVVIDPLKRYGFAEHDRAGELGGLWFEIDKSTSDYDGVFSLSLECAAAIEALGYTIEESQVLDSVGALAQAAGGFLALAKAQGLEVTIVDLVADVLEPAPVNDTAPLCLCQEPTCRGICGVPI